MFRTHIYIDVIDLIFSYSNLNKHIQVIWKLPYTPIKSHSYFRVYSNYNLEYVQNKNDNGFKQRIDIEETQLEGIEIKQYVYDNNKY
jgi:hypothetical protein